MLLIIKQSWNWFSK